MSLELPLIVEASQLKQHLNTKNILIIDISNPAAYLQQHIPGAIYLNYEWIVRMEPPRMGLLPFEEQINRVFSSLGMNQDTHIIAYDDEGGGRACRLLWTLDAAGHKHFSFLNGGLAAWVQDGNETSNDIRYPNPTASHYHASMNDEPVATQQYIKENLDNDDVVIFDTRSPAEFSGTKVFAQRGGHIPGAVNIDWTDAMDKKNNMRLKPEAELRKMYEANGIVTNKTIVTHCQAHHRSAHTYIVLKSLGYENVKGYPGSWSDWGNMADTPIES